MALNLFLTAVCLTLIFYLSSRDGTQTYQDSIKITRFVARLLYGRDVPPETLDTLHSRIRLCAHVTLYAALGFISGSWAMLGRNPQSRIRLAVLAGGACTAVGFLDEWLKQFVPGRHFHLDECLLNAASAAVGLLVCCAAGFAARRISAGRAGTPPP